MRAASKQVPTAAVCRSFDPIDNLHHDVLHATVRSTACDSTARHCAKPTDVFAPDDECSGSSGICSPLRHLWNFDRSSIKLAAVFVQLVLIAVTAALQKSLS